MRLSSQTQWPWQSKGRLLAALLVLSTACAGQKNAVASRELSAGAGTRAAEASRSGANPDVPGLELGAYSLGSLSKTVVDGDTIRVREIKPTLRLLGLDCEETFKRNKDRDAYAAGWEQYRRGAREDSARPVKLATPMGEEAKEFAKHFFKDVREVRLERDHPDELRDTYGRYLVYVFAEKNGEWKNYNVEAVRAGMSPYYNKYGNSRRFHREFVQAQEEAQAARRGIWDPNGQHYDDYPERLAWWNERAAMVARFEKLMEEEQDHLVLTRWDSMEKLQARLGQTVTVFGVVNHLRVKPTGPLIAKLSRARGSDLDIVFHDRALFAQAGLSEAKGEYVQVRGTVSEYRRTPDAEPKLQIVVASAGQVLVPKIDPRRLLAQDKAVSAPDADGAQAGADE